MAFSFFEKVADGLDSALRATKLAITYTYQGFATSDSGNSTIYKVEDLYDIYKIIDSSYSFDRNYLIGRKDDFEPSFKIVISGKVDNNPLNLIFNNLKSFHDYLDKKGLMPKAVTELKLEK